MSLSTIIWKLWEFWPNDIQLAASGVPEGALGKSSGLEIFQDSIFMQDVCFLFVDLIWYVVCSINM